MNTLIKTVAILAFRQYSTQSKIVCQQFGYKCLSQASAAL